jgi:LmbE family N-acetylglucosaminyl deacetylase
MRRLALDGDAPLSVVAIAAHPDDIEIGCGGTVLRLVAEGRVASMTWVVLTGDGRRRQEAEAAARAFVPAPVPLDVRQAHFPDGYLPGSYAHVKRYLHDIDPSVPAPDLVLVPRREDAHQDHRLIAELAPTAFRDSLILEYEIPKYDGDLAALNAYVELSPEVVATKVELLLRAFPSQLDRPWFTEETFRAILRLRGVEARAASGYAEGFVARKVVL